MSDVKKVDFYSRLLKKESSMLVYLPEHYEEIELLPVQYFLHGRSGDENIMYELDLQTTSDRMIKSGEIKPLVIVCLRIENSRGMNSLIKCKRVLSLGDGEITINLGMYEDYFIKEVIPLVDQMFPTIKNRTGRYIGGVSGGGCTALHNAFRRQDLFTKVGGHMPAMELTLEEVDRPFFKHTAMWEKYDPIFIAKHVKYTSYERGG